MLIRHLGLTVRDAERSKDFYLTVIGLDGEARPRPMGLPARSRRRLHARVDPGRAVAERSTPTPCTSAARSNSPRKRAGSGTACAKPASPRSSGRTPTSYTGVKVQDPDGYIIELFHEIT